MYNMENSPNRYYQMIRNYQETQLLFTAIKLNIFTYLDTPMTSNEIAKKIKYNAKNIELLLMSLLSCGLVSKHGDYYLNTPETKDFLSRNSDVFIGDALIFREQMTSLEKLESRIKAAQNLEETQYDFAKLAKVTIPEMYTGRVQSFIGEMEKIFTDKNEQLNILDLGGGTGILSIEFTRCFPSSKATVFESPDVAVVAKEIIKANNAENNVSVVSGDFNTDKLGGKYDLIIASGILNFVNGSTSKFIKKMAASLCDGGYLLIVGQFADHSYQVPPNMLGWLSGFLNGVPLPPSNEEITNSIRNADLKEAAILKDGQFQGKLYIKGSDTMSVYSVDVINSFIELTEQITNSKTNILNFEQDDMTFYRGEIHMIKMIGDYPGIYSAELARKFGITRPVVHKTLQRLSERDFITKEEDENNRKLYRLFLTQKGQQAYRYHQEYHEQNDKDLFEFLSDMSSEQLSTVKKFLDNASTVIQKHA